MHTYVIHRQLHNRNLAQKQSLMSNKNLEIFSEEKEFTNLMLYSFSVDQEINQRKGYTDIEMNGNAIYTF